MITKLSDFSFLNENRILYINSDGLSNFPLVHMGKKSYISDVTIEAGIFEDSTSLLIGNYCSISHDVKFLLNLDHTYWEVSTFPLELLNSEWKRPPNIRKGEIVIGNDVWIGRGATILDGVTIGNGAVVAANSTVTKDVPPYSIVVGNPAKIKKYRFSNEIILKLNTIKWWYWHYEEILKNKEFFSNYSEKIIDELYNKVLNQKYQERNSTKNEFESIKEKFLFIADFDIQYSIWEKIIFNFIEYYSYNEDVILIIYVDNLEIRNEEINYILGILSKMDNVPLIAVETKSDFENELELLRKVDYFITSRDIRSIKMIDYAKSYNVKIISGMRENIFSV